MAPLGRTAFNAAEERGADQDSDTQSDTEREQRPSLGLRTHARHGVAAVAGAELERPVAEPRRLPARRFAAVAEALDHVAQHGRNRLADLLARRRGGGGAAAAGDAADLFELLLDRAEMALNRGHARTECIGAVLEHGVPREPTNSE